MQQTNIYEIEKLLKIMQKYGIRCSLEFKVAEESEPLLGITQASVTVEYFEDENKEKYLLITLNDADFSFNEKKSTFHKYVSDCQFDICVSSDIFAAWFSSDTLPIEAISEAKLTTYQQS
jgi:hypothetical protein